MEETFAVQVDQEGSEKSFALKDIPSNAQLSFSVLI